MSPTNYKIERKFARYALDVRAKLCAGEVEIKVRTLDVSEGGLGLISPAEIPEASRNFVEFEFPTLPGMFRVEVCARSRVGFRYGFSFVNVDESSMNLLRKYQRRWGILARENYAARD
jgi:c-di-GMP-binding flagellar brake protein YcgR